MLPRLQVVQSLAAAVKKTFEAPGITIAQYFTLTPDLIAPVLALLAHCVPRLWLPGAK
jgi:hypothetical protein